jgi:hypothetical protein
LFTPAPWRLITDTTLWSENWPGVPQPSRGEASARFTHCALCPAACGVRARCIDGRPVSLAGAAGHPLSRGALCPWGIAAHHLPFHPARLRHGDSARALAAVKDAAGRCRPGERVAVLDLCPGRTASWTMRRALASLPNGTYLAHPRPEYAIDFSSVRTVLSLGVPLLDGWGTPGSVMAARRQFRLIQAEPVESRTAALADLWVPIEPGEESAAVAQFEAELRSHGPSVILSGEYTPEVARLNESLGAPIFERREAPVPAAWKTAVPVTAIEAVPDASIRILLIDESAPLVRVPWSAIAPKLTDGAVVVAFSCTPGTYSAHAQFNLPVPVYPEAFADMPPAIDTVPAVFRITAPLIEPQAATVTPAEFVAQAAAWNPDDPLRERADAIHQTARGEVFTPTNGETVPLKSLTADAFWAALTQGACWIEKASARKRAILPLAPSPHPQPPGLVVVVPEQAPPPLNSPLITKLYRESNLRQAVNRIALSPADARARCLADNGRALLEISNAAGAAVLVTVDPGIPPGIVQAAAGWPALAGARTKVVAL